MGYYAVSYMRYNTVNGTFDDFLADMKNMNFNSAVQKYYGEASGDALKTKIMNMSTTGINGLLAAAHISLNDDYADAITDWSASAENIVPNGGGPVAIQDKITTKAMGEASCKITWAETDYDRKNLRLQIGANAGQELSFAIGNMRSVELIGSQDIDVGSYQAATTSISRFDGAIQKVSTYRASLGAVQNRLEHTIANLDTSAENLQAAESSLRDTDMAEEMAKYSKNNILMQAGQSMLAQANQSTQGVMSLLQ